MDPKTAAAAAALRAEIARHDLLYHRDAAPEITDAEYDALVAELQALEREHPDLVAADSPSRRVGAAPAAEAVKVRHDPPMLSIAKADGKTEDERAADVGRFFAAVAAETRRLGLPAPDFAAELKIDGLSLALRYEDGLLVRAATRGDGRAGEDVTAAARRIASLPRTLPADAPRRLEVRGEVYLSRERFRLLRAEQEEAGADRLFANPRNAAAGTLKLDDPDLVAARGLEAWLYQIVDAAGAGFDSHAESLDALARWGFPVNPERRRLRTAEEFLRVRRDWDERRHALPYDTDGIVIKVDPLETQNALGLGTTSPNWALAFKFAPEQVETTLREVRLQVGKSGAVTPVAVLDPVFLAGTTVTHASLHNFDLVREKDLRLGDRVLIEKAGEIIPQIVRSLPEKRTGNETEILPPAHCPECSSPLSRREGKGRNAALLCTNPDCPARARERLLRFVSRDTMDLQGCGEAVIDALLARKRVRDPADLYRLSKEEWVEALRRAPAAPGGAEQAALLDAPVKGKKSGPDKAAQNLLDAVEASKQRGLARLLAALAIPHVGDTAAQLLAARYGSLDALLAAPEEELSAVEAGDTSAYRTLGRTAAHALAEALRDPALRARIAPPPPRPGTTPSLFAAQEAAHSTADLALRLASLALPGFAERKCEAVARRFGSADALLAADERSLESVELGTSEVKRTLGPEAARSLRAWLDAPKHRELLARLREAGVSMEAARTATTAASGKVFVLTGTLPTLKREDAKRRIEAAGGSVAGAVSRKVDFVVAGEEAGSKLDKAKELGVAVLDEAQLLALLGG